MRNLILIIGFSLGVTTLGATEWEHLGLFDRQVNSVAVADDFLYAATDSGLYRTTFSAGGTSWELLGMVGNDVRGLLALSPDTLIAGTSTPPVAIYRTTDGGNTWEPYENGFGGGTFLPVRGFDRATSQPGTFFAIGQGIVARSTDSGQSWQPMLGGWNESVGVDFVKVDYYRPHIIWAGGEGIIFNPLLFKSNDSGENWEQLNVVNTGDNACLDIAEHPVDSGLVYVSMEGQIQKTTNGGAAWEIIHFNILYNYGIELDSLRPTIFYASGGQHGRPLTIIKTDDGGSTFSEIIEPTQPEVWAFDLLLLPCPNRNILLFPTNAGVFRYTDWLDIFCGDADGSSAVDIDDVVYLIAYIFSGGPAPSPLAAGDADCSGAIDIDDVVYLISYIFSGGNAPCDPNGDELPDC